MRGTEYHVAQCHIAEERTPRSQCWVNLAARAGRSCLLVLRHQKGLSGVHECRVSDRPGPLIVYGLVLYFWMLNIEVASCNPSGA